MSAKVQQRRAAEIVGDLAPRFAAREAEHDRAGRFAEANVDDLRGSGLLALNVPATGGGLGADLAETSSVLRELAKSAPSTALMLAMHTSILANYLIDPALVPERDRDAFLEQRDWASSEALDGKVFAVANSEPGADGDVHNSQATFEAGRFNGLKSFASFGAHADYYMAAGRSGERVDYFLVRNDGRSVHVEREWNAIGMRSSDSSVLRFIDAPVIGPLCYEGLLDGPNLRHWSTLSFTSIFLGIGESFFEEVRSKHERMLQKVELTELHLQLQACRAFLADTIAREHQTSGEQPPGPNATPPYLTQRYKELVRDCKTFVTRTLARHALEVFMAQSGSAYSMASPVSRKFRDLLAGPALRPPCSVAFDEIWQSLEP